MVDFNLDRSFDLVTCLFSSIGYVKTIDNLEQASSTMDRHLKPGGMLLSNHGSVRKIIGQAD